MAKLPQTEPEQTSWKVLVVIGLGSLFLIAGSIVGLSVLGTSDGNGSSNTVEIVSPPVNEAAVEPARSPTAVPVLDQSTDEPDSEDKDVAELSEPSATAAPTARSTAEPTREPRPTSTPRPTATPDSNNGSSLAELAASLLGDRGSESAAAELDDSADEDEVGDIPALPRVIPSGQGERPLATSIPIRPTAVPQPQTQGTPAATASQSQTTRNDTAASQQTAAAPAAPPLTRQQTAAPTAGPTPFEYVYTKSASGSRQVRACNVGSVYIDLNFDGSADAYLNSPCDYCPSGSLPQDRNSDGMLDC